MNKKEVRKEIVNKLKKIDRLEKSRQEQQLYKKLFNEEIFLSASSIGLTKSMWFEIDTQPIIKELFRLKKHILVPKILFDDEIHFFEIKKILNSSSQVIFKLKSQYPIKRYW